MKHVLLGLTAAFVGALPSIATAQVCAEFTASSAELQVFYDPFQHAPVERSFSLQVRRLDPTITAVRFILADPDTAGVRPQLGLGGPTYEIVWAREPGRRAFASGGEQPNNTNGAQISFGGASDRAVRDETFRIRIPAGEDLAAGTYYQPLDILFQCYAGDSLAGPTQVQRDGRVAVDLIVPEQIKSFIGSQGVRRGRLDFGVLTPALGRVSRNLSITAQSTVPYEVDFSAQHGALKRSADDPAAIPYQTWFADLPVRSGSRVGCAKSPAPQGRTHILRAEVDGRQSASAPAGSYGETITITFSPRLGLAGGDGCDVLRF